MLSLNQEIAKRIHNAQLDNEGDYSPKGYAKAFGLGALDGLIDCLIIGGVMLYATAIVTTVAKAVKKNKG